MIYNRFPARGAKSVSRKKLKDLDQGAIPADALPPHESDDVVAYPSVLQGVKNNMAKFDTCVVLTRVGNFYELYFEHAEDYGPLLGLKVSSKRTNAGPVAMSGFPFWQLDRFLKILVQDMNKHVAISEEFPATVSGKVKSGGLLFDRKVARVVTPGTLIDEKFLDPYQNNFLLSIHLEDTDASPSSIDPPNVGLAWLDLSTGDFFTQTTTLTLLPSVLLRVGAREVLLPSKLPNEIKDKMELILKPANEIVTSHRPRSAFVSMSAWNQFLETPITQAAESKFAHVEKLAGHQLLDYVHTNLQGLQLQLRAPQRREMTEILSIDRSSLRGLEILETSRDGFGKGSLFYAVKRTVTKSGARLLRDRLTSPSASLTDIQNRLDLVTQFYNSEMLREQLLHHLRKTHDVQRLVQKFTLNKGDADDMLCLAKAIHETAAAHDVLQQSEEQSTAAVPPNPDSHNPNPVQRLLANMSLSGPTELCDRISDAIDEEGLSAKHELEELESANIAALAQEVAQSSGSEELNALPKQIRSRAKSRDQEVDVKETWIMRRESSSTLARLHSDLDSMRLRKDELEARLSSEIAAPSLTLKWTPGLGHICHIKSATSFNKDALESLNARMVSSSKSTRSFYLSDWTRLGNSMDQIRGQIRSEEQRIFDGLRQLVIRNLVHLRRNARVMDEIDVANSFAVLAHEQGWTRPVLNNGLSHKIFGGRHPTVKLGLEERGQSFVSNDLHLDEKQRIWIITGPNMAGKSTFLRQNALITILAQVGSYVPADYAELGLVDQIFSRIGAADDLYRDQSTFMVEMLETSSILRYATPRSFVIMDEVGRGTTPEDGTAVAFASLHHLYNQNKCRTLFATHFHRLHDLTHDWVDLGRYCTDIYEDEQGHFSFIHKLKPGVNKESHALKVAKMAGLPESAIQVARDVFESLRGTQT